MRALAGLLVKIAAAQHVVDRQADALVELADDLDRVDLPVDRLVVAIDGRRLLEERVVIVPRPQLVDAHAALPGQHRVDLGLGRVERLAGQGVEFVEELEHLLLALFGQGKLHHVKVLEAELPGRAVPQAGQLYRSGSRIGPTALLASQTARRRAESFEVRRTSWTSFSVSSFPATLARKTP